jgi:hypothetical protein
MIAQNGIIFTNIINHVDQKKEDMQQRIISRLLQHVNCKSTNEQHFQDYKENFAKIIN